MFGLLVIPAHLFTIIYIGGYKEYFQFGTMILEFIGLCIYSAFTIIATYQFIRYNCCGGKRPIEYVNDPDVIDKQWLQTTMFFVCLVTFPFFLSCTTLSTSEFFEQTFYTSIFLATHFAEIVDTFLSLLYIFMLPEYKKKSERSRAEPDTMV